MSSFYRITVSRNGHFYFRADDEFVSRQIVINTVEDFHTRFPDSEGFKVELMRWECSGKTINA
jgi:hypothetical protein